MACGVARPADAGGVRVSAVWAVGEACATIKHRKYVGRATCPHALVRFAARALRAEWSIATLASRRTRLANAGIVRVVALRAT